MEYINQDEQVSKTDQVIKELTNNTTVNVVSLKDILLDNKEEYDVFRYHGDPSHWSWRGAFLCYQQIMETVNQNNDEIFKVLLEEDFEISTCDQGKYIFRGFSGSICTKGRICREIDVESLQRFSTDARHSVWKNSNVENNAHVLIVGDSYVNSYLLSFFAESFSKTSLIWDDYTTEMEDMIEICMPDIVIYECAERVDRSVNICEIAEGLNN